MEKSIKSRFFKSIYTIIVVSTIVIDTLVFFIYKNDVEFKINSYGQQAVENMSLNLSKKILQVEENITYKIHDTSLFTPNSVKEGLVNSNPEIKAFVALLRNGDMDVKSCYVERVDGARVYLNDGDRSFEDLKTSEVWNTVERMNQEPLNNRGTIIWRRFDDSPDSIFIIKNVIAYNDLKKQALLCLEINGNYFEKLCSAEFMPFIVNDENGDVLYYSDKIRINDEKNIDKRYWEIHSDVGKKKWKLIGLANKNESYENLKNLLFSITMLEVLLLVFSLLITSKVADAITTNIRNLTSSMKKLEKGEKVESIHSVTEDETGYLVKVFNDLNARLNTTIETLTEKEVEKERAEYNALMTKLNPHFLYNALESISAMAKLNGQNRIVEAIVSLSKLLRSSLSKTDEIVLLKQELDYVEQYLKIEQLISGDKLEWIIDCEADRNSVSIPRFIMQPIVENAIVHGLKDKTEDAVIVIHIFEEKRLMIEISDNGCGMSQNRADAILNAERYFVDDNDRTWRSRRWWQCVS